MARAARIVIPGTAHHVVARGVDGIELFRSGFDKKRYKKRMAIIADQEGVSVHAFCLMKNHVHYLLTPKRREGLARFFNRLHGWWSSFINAVKKRTGHLFGGRYRSSPVDEAHFWATMRYIELNPKRAGLVDDPAEWEHSSARAHVYDIPDPIVKLANEAIAHRKWNGARWREFLEESDAEREAHLEKCLRGSHPCGDSRWVESVRLRLEAVLGYSWLC